MSLRTSLHPALGAAISAVLSDSDEAPPGEELLENHDVRALPALLNPLRRAADDALYQRFRWRRFRKLRDVQLALHGPIKRSPWLAFALMASHSGFVREVAAAQTARVFGPFTLSCLAYRTNDWVPEVRTAATAKLRLLAPRLAMTDIVAAEEYLSGFERLGRASEDAAALIADLLNRSDVVAVMRRRVLSGRDDATLRLFQRVLSTPVVDADLARLALDHPHARLRALAAETALRGSHMRRTRRGLVRRPLQAGVDAERLAHALLRDKSADVQKRGLIWLSHHRAIDEPLTAVFLEFASHPNRPLRATAQWRLTKSGVDWLEHVRARMAVEPSVSLARVVGESGNSGDAARLLEVAVALADRAAVPYLAPAAELGAAAAIERLQDIVLNGADLDLARRASAALAVARAYIPAHALAALADAPCGFMERGLRRHMSRASVAQQLILFCKLERSGQHMPTTLEFYRLLALINRAHFVVIPAEQGELAALASDCPAVRELAHRILALRL